MAKSLRKPTVRKPTITDKALAFAESGGAKKSEPRFAPPGDVRLTVNLRADIHAKLKHAAIDQHTTVGDLIERLVAEYL